MVVDSFLEMYTTLFGWMFYNIIYHTLKDVGFFFLPFIGLIIDHYRALSSTDPSDKDGGKEIQRSFEDKLKWMVIVFMIAIAPFFSFSATEIQHRPKELIDRLNDSGTITPLYNLATAEGNFDLMKLDGYPISVDVPLWWMVLSKVFSGINHKIIHSIPAKRDLAGLLSRSRVSRIRDPDLRQEVEKFSEQCYSKAAADFQKNEDDYRALAGFQTIADEYGEDDPFFLGSRFFIRYIYGKWRSNEPVKGFPYSPLRDVEYLESVPTPRWGHPYCVEWWEDKLQPAILDHVQELTGYQSIVDAFTGYSSAKTEYFAIKNALNNTDINWTGSGYDYAYYYFNGANGTAGLAGAGMTINTYADAVMENAKARIMLENAPLVQALVLCCFYAFLIFVFLLGGYDLKVAIIASWGFFTLKFLSVCIYIAWWLEQNLIEAMFPDANMLEIAARTMEGLVNTPSGSLQRRILMLDNLTNGLYIGIPTLYIILCGWGGIRMMGGLEKGAGLGGGGMAGIKTTARSLVNARFMGKG